MKKLLICLTILFSVFLFNKKVMASSPVIFEKSADNRFFGGFTVSNLQTFLNYNNKVDFSVYDKIIIFTKNGNAETRLNIFVYKSSQASRLNISNNIFSVNAIVSGEKFYYYDAYVYSAWDSNTVNLSTLNYQKTLYSANSESLSYQFTEILYHGTIQEALNTAPPEPEFDDFNNNGIDDSTEYITINFNNGGNGIFNSGAITTYTLLPGYDNYPTAPKITPNDYYIFTGWNNNIPTGQIPIGTTSTTYTATYFKANNINDLNCFTEEITEDYLYKITNMSKSKYPYVAMWGYVTSSGYLRYNIYFFQSNKAVGFNDKVAYKFFAGNVAYDDSNSKTVNINQKTDLSTKIKMKEYREYGNSSGFFDFDNFYYFSNFNLLRIDGSNFAFTGENYLKKTVIPKYKVTFNLNGGKATDTNEIMGDDGAFYTPVTLGNSYTVPIQANRLHYYLINQVVKKENMHFIGWYYDEKLTKKVNSSDILTGDCTLYAKYRYIEAGAFLENTNFNKYTFDTNYNYAIITLGDYTGDIYLGLEYMTYDLEIYEYEVRNNSYVKGSVLCLTPQYSYNDVHYYIMESSTDENIKVLVLPKEKLEQKINGETLTYYDFYLSNNAYITYTNDLFHVEIYDPNGDKIDSDLNDSFDFSQDLLINSENDLLEIFKKLLSEYKDNKVFQHIGQVYDNLKNSRIFIYINLLLVGSLIILIIKAAKRN